MSTAPEALHMLANFLDTLASDQRACIRFQSRKKDIVECEVKAATYADAAKIAREHAAKHDKRSATP